jgi:hypothetical protein
MSELDHLDQEIQDRYEEIWRYEDLGMDTSFVRTRISRLERKRVLMTGGNSAKRIEA